MRGELVTVIWHYRPMPRQCVSITWLYKLWSVRNPWTKPSVACYCWCWVRHNARRETTCRPRPPYSVLPIAPGQWRQTELLVQSALELEHLTQNVGLPAEPIVHLLEEVLQKLGAADSLLAAKILGSLARALRYTGAQQQAVTYAQQAVAMARRCDNPVVLAANLNNLAFVLDGPEHTLQRLAYVNEAVTLATAGNARELLYDAHWLRAYCLLELGDMPTMDAAIAATLYQLLLPYAERTVVIGNAVACYGAMSHYLGAFATTMGRWDTAAQHFEHALAMNARMDARPWLAHPQYAYATMLLARNQPGDGDKATALLDAALVTAHELGMHALEERLTACLSQTVTPLPPATLSSLDDLSQRKVEVLRLLAAGRSNRDIADALYISLNTVATHVRNILTKTGTANRTEAAAYTLRHGLLVE